MIPIVVLLVIVLIISVCVAFFYANEVAIVEIRVRQLEGLVKKSTSTVREEDKALVKTLLELDKLKKRYKG